MYTAMFTFGFERGKIRSFLCQLSYSWINETRDFFIYDEHNFYLTFQQVFNAFICQILVAQRSSFKFNTDQHVRISKQEVDPQCIAY